VPAHVRAAHYRAGRERQGARRRPWTRRRRARGPWRRADQLSWLAEKRGRQRDEQRPTLWPRAPSLADGVDIRDILVGPAPRILS